jgi:VWFA-related protein
MNGSFLTLCVLGVSAANNLPAATKLLVTVVEQKSGRPITDLKATDFSVLDHQSRRQVDSSEFTHGLIDVMLLLDTSLVGAAVQPVAASLIAQLQPKDQMAVVSFHSSADLVQDFTSSRELLMRAVGSVRYGNVPRVLDALYAAIDGGFQNASFRRVILLLTTGMEGGSRVSERDVIKLARRNGVSIFPVYLAGSEKSLFESLARQTGGASFNLRDMRKGDSPQPAVRIFEALRGHYTLTLEGNLSLGDQIKVEVKAPGKLFVSALPLD